MILGHFVSADRYVLLLMYVGASEMPMEDKLNQLEDATAAAQYILSIKESEISTATEALRTAKSKKLKSLNPEAQQTLHVNDTELPELISAELQAREEYESAKARYETNLQYLKFFRERLCVEEEKSSDR